ncbi:tRNA (adenosine(37)-N6)-threonylcarbamoyltransferase complex ATPase subunit type 1 TsaE [Candidatus Gracilibacteria bacterium]|nr:tRNA (adenosine(37)-N6)-threonylcarbamoyltransferase complex ATPase subunit type 1 TsaE [Candidatus Gracilibacteria bacterium]
MIVNSPIEMLKLGNKLAKEAKVLLLRGDLGAGKTLLTKGFAKGLGIDENIVQSPTYAYINIYEDKLLHIDMYRIEHYSDLVEKGILDQIHQYEYIVIERPKFIDKLGLINYLNIEIIKKSVNIREVNIIKV